MLFFGLVLDGDDCDFLGFVGGVIVIKILFVIIWLVFRLLILGYVGNFLFFFLDSFLGFFCSFVRFKFLVFREVFKFDISLFFFGFFNFLLLWCFVNDRTLGVLVFLFLEGFDFCFGIGGCLIEFFVGDKVI